MVKKSQMGSRFKKGQVKSKRTKLYKTPSPFRVHLFKRMGVRMAITNSSVTAGAVTTVGPITVGTPVTDTVGYAVSGSLIFTLSNVEVPADITQLYDRYKITGVKVKFIPLFNFSSTVNTGYLPELMTCIDYDDSALPTESTLRQRNIRIKRLDKPVSVFIKPKLAGMVYQGTSTAGYSIDSARYLNCAYPDIQHFGLKFIIKNMDLRTAYVNSVNVETTYYLAMKDPQ